ncbi:hypothetical protein ACFLU1_05880 [Chloroflexota bacterium]
MERINPAFFYALGAELAPLTKMEPNPQTRVSIWIASLRTEPTVVSLLDFYSGLTVCRRTGHEFINAVAEERKWIHDTPSKDWEQADPSVDSIFRSVIDKAKEFQAVLSEELQTLDTYHASQKGIYSTTGLIEEAEKVLPGSVLQKIDDKIVGEIRQSGRCLAFDVSTASAFHIMRATETVIHKYYLQVCKPKSKKKLDNWGMYIAKLTQSQDSQVKEVVALLQQIKDRHRNLIMHPEVVLTPDEAFTLFEIAQSAIIAMAGYLPIVKGKS